MKKETSKNRNNIVLLGLFFLICPIGMLSYLLMYGILFWWNRIFYGNQPAKKEEKAASS